MSGGTENDRPSLSASTTSWSKHTASLQRRFNRNAREEPIVFVDRDELILNFHLLNRKETMCALLRARIGKQASFICDKDSVSANLINAAVNGSGMAHGPRLREQGSDHYKNVKIVIGGDRDERNAWEDHAYISPWLDHPALTPQALIARQVDYHEIGHALDCKFFPNINLQDMPDWQAFYRHEAEMFADIMSVFLLAQDGIKNAGKIVMLPRLLRLLSEGEATNRDLNNRRSYECRKIYWYATGKGIAAAQKTLDEFGADIAAFSTAELVAHAYQLTEANFLSRRQGEILCDLQDSLFEIDILKHLRARLRLDTEEDDFQFAEDFIRDTEDALRNLLNPALVEEAPVVLSQAFRKSLDARIAAAKEHGLKKDFDFNNKISDFDLELEDARQENPEDFLVNAAALYCETRDEIRRALQDGKTLSIENALKEQLAVLEKTLIRHNKITLMEAAMLKPQSANPAPQPGPAAI